MTASLLTAPITSVSVDSRLPPLLQKPALLEARAHFRRSSQGRTDAGKGCAGRGGRADRGCRVL